MNFQELMRRMAELDQPIQEADKGDMDKDGKDEPDTKEYMDNKDAVIKKAIGKEEKVDEEVVDECGMMGGLPPPMSAPKQQDSVTMNVSMNGSGAGGIRDLLNVLKDIQDGPSDNMPGDDMDMGPEEPGDDVLLKKKIDSMGGMIDDDFGNSALGDTGPKIGGVDMVTHDGDDLHHTKGAYPKASGGDNAMQLKDGETRKIKMNSGDKVVVDGDLKLKLESLYHEIKNR